MLQAKIKFVTAKTVPAPDVPVVAPAAHDNIGRGFGFSLFLNF